VEVQTTPAGATIKVNDQVRCVSNCKLDLAPGSYQLQIALPGYEPAMSSLTVLPGNPVSVNLELQAIPQSLRLFTDLDSGKVFLDGQEIGDLTDGQFVLDKIPPGKHALKVQGRNGEAAFEFESTPGTAPTITGQITSKNLMPILVTSFGNEARLHSSSGPVKVILDGQAVGEATPGGLMLKTTPGDRELTWGEGKDQRKLVISLTETPALTAYLKLDVNAGTLVVLAGEEGAEVFINGVRHRRTTGRGGQLRISPLAVKSHTVRVAKDGYQAEPEKTAEVRKGEETKVEFTLRPIPKMAALQIRGGTPGATVMVNKESIGTIGPDGTFSASNIPPGDHTIDLRREQYTARQHQRSFRAGETVQLTGAEAVLERAPGVIRVALSPPEARLTYRRADQQQVQQARDNSLSVSEGTYILTATAPGYTSRTETVQVGPGETRNISISLVRERTAAAAPPKVEVAAMGDWENPEAWRPDGSWRVRKGGGHVLYRTVPLAGSIMFTGRLVDGRRLQWVVDFQDPRNYALYQMERRELVIRDVINGRHQRERVKVRHPLEKQDFYTIQLEIHPDTVITRYFDGKIWVQIDEWKQPGRNFTDGKFGFYIPGNDEYAVTNFSFKPR
jgi:hypothetical protein